ncbi:MAG: HAD family phosphatase [Pseudomonadales bacterium]
MTDLARPAAVVFDMDGLLLDSERLAQAAFREACTELGVTVDDAVYARCIGSTPAGTEQILREAVGADLDYPSLDRIWSDRYAARLDAGPVDLKPGALDLLDALAAHGIPRGLATSTGRDLATRKLTGAGVISYFACLICGGETARGKPHPDPYLAAVACLGVPAGAAWALEDSENGVRAAHAAGLRVIQVPDLVAPSAALRSLGHDVLPSLRHVLAALLPG